MATNDNQTDSGNRKKEAEIAQLKEIVRYIKELRDPKKTDTALQELAKRRDTHEGLAILLWQSVFTVQILVCEVMRVYEYLNPPTLTSAQSNRACNALALLQCIASHKHTRGDLVSTKILVFLYPFLRTSEYGQKSPEDQSSKPHSFLRLTSLGVIGSLVKTDDESVIKFLLETEYMPICLSIIEHGNDLTKTVACYILFKILSANEGLNYCCASYERFSHVAFILSKVVEELAEVFRKKSGETDYSESIKLFYKILKCYIRLCDNSRAKKALAVSLPETLKNNFFSRFLDEQDKNRNHKDIQDILIRLKAIISKEHDKD